MKRAISAGAAGLLGTVLLLLGGCSSYDTQSLEGHSFAGVKHVFVLSNLNDNHAIDHHLAEALKARGYDVETGPLTMMPDDTQAVISYEDHWTWDFGDHLVYLQLHAADRRTRTPLGNARFNARIPPRKSLPEIVDELLGRLLAGH